MFFVLFFGFLDAISIVVFYFKSSGHPIFFMFLFNCFYSLHSSWSLQPFRHDRSGRVDIVSDLQWSFGDAGELVSELSATALSAAQNLSALSLSAPSISQLVPADAVYCYFFKLSVWFFLSIFVTHYN